MLKPVVMYGRGARYITEKHKFMLNMGDKKILRKVYEPITEQVAWRIRTIHELMELYITLISYYILK
jgi:hypothetical protein